MATALKLPDVLRLQTLVEEILISAPEGLSEIELFMALESRGLRVFGREVFGENLALFRAHFILFHVLYALRQRLWLEKRYELEISCLKLVLKPYHETTSRFPVEHDPMGAYYTDLKNLADTGEQDLDKMLGDFWSWFAGASQRDDALLALGLERSADFSTIKRRYHRLAMEHHPDRGGDAAKLQQINAAMDVLKH